MMLCFELHKTPAEILALPRTQIFDLIAYKIDYINKPEHTKRSS